MDINSSKDVTTEIECMCELLDKNMCDTAVIVINRDTGEVSTFGSSIGSLFFAQNPPVATMFRDFCLVYMKGNGYDNKGNKSENNVVNSEEHSLTENCDNAMCEKISICKDSLSESTECDSDCLPKNEEEKITHVKGETGSKTCYAKLEKLADGSALDKTTGRNDSILSRDCNIKAIVDTDKTKNKNLSEIKVGHQTRFTCRICRKSFKSKAGLSSHEKYIHGQIQYKGLEKLENREKNIKQLSYIDKEGNETSGPRRAMYEKTSDNTSTRYLCNICSYSTERYNGIIEHTQTHVIMNELTCSLCDKSFKVKKSLWRHTKQHKKLPHMCKTCLKMFEKKEDLEIHQMSHSSSHICDICDRVYDCIGRLNYHKKISHGPKLVNCEICSSSFTRQSLLRQHMKRHGPKQFFCDKCSCSYFFMHQLTNHLKTHDESSVRYKCNVCPREYVNISHWKEHMKLHDGSNFVQCDKCGKSYSSKKGLNLHKKTKHLDERKFVCQICEKAFLTKHHLKNHLITHNEKRDYKCRFCDAAFKRNEVLKMHENVHTKERKFICDMCGEYFLRRSSLRNHRLTHFTEYQRWKCRYCEIRFRSQSSMMTHIKNRHAEVDLAHERPLCRKCKQCGKIFAKGLTFRIHMDMHAGIKRHKCRLCGNAFTDPANLRMHIKIHGGSLKNKRHVCSKCGLNFRSAKLLQDHNMTTHDKSNLYEGQKNLRFEQNEGLDLSSMQYKPVEGEIITSDTSDNVLAGENCKRKFVTATQQAFGDFNSGLMPLHASHGLVNIGQQLTTGNYFGNSRTLTSIGSANIVNSDIGFSISKNEIVQMNSEVDHRQLRSDSMTNNLTTLTGSSGKGDDTDPHLEAQPCYNSHL